jgi:hypothetical protein
MENDKATFSQAMRHAKSSGAVSGGSTAVRGKAMTTVKTQAFMAATSDDETEDEAPAPPPTLIVIDTESEDEESDSPPPTSPGTRTTTQQQHAPRTSFYDEEYVHGQRVVRTTRPSLNDFDPEPQLTAVLNHTDPNMTRVRARIAHALTQRDYFPDFRVQDIPPREANASLHDRLHPEFHHRWLPP